MEIIETEEVRDTAVRPHWRPWAIGLSIPVALWLVVVIGIAMKHHYDHVRWYESPEKAEHMLVGWLTVAAVIVVLALMMGIVAIGLMLASAKQRADERFEADIAHLSPEEQANARRGRALVHTAVVVGASLAAHEYLQHRERRMQEDLDYTAERNQRVTDGLEAHQAHMAALQDERRQRDEELWNTGGRALNEARRDGRGAFSN
jgi:hypothetical protein